MSSTQHTSLPPFPSDAPDQIYVSVKVINTGYLYLPYLEVFQDSIDLPNSEGSTVPVFTFLVEHPTRGRTLFDLGLKKVSMLYCLRR